MVIDDETFVDLSVLREEILEVFFGGFVVDVTNKYFAFFGLIIRSKDPSFSQMWLCVDLAVRNRMDKVLTSLPSISCLDASTLWASEAFSYSRNAKPSGWLVFLDLTRMHDFSLPKSPKYLSSCSGDR